jgi:hypothetical protein
MTATIRRLFKKESRMAAHLRKTNPQGYAQFIRHLVAAARRTCEWLGFKRRTRDHANCGLERAREATPRGASPATTD